MISVLKLQVLSTKFINISNNKRTAVYYWVFFNLKFLLGSSQQNVHENNTNKFTHLEVYDPKLKYPFFNWNTFRTNLSTRNYGQFAVHFDVVESTMTVFDK